ncbi:MAG: tripartite tricarboxylate transporter TctB family protein [Acidobacteriota bacterium]
MQVNGSALVGLFYSLVFVLAMGTAWHLPAQATLFPLAAGSAGLILSLYQVVRELKGRALGPDDDNRGYLDLQPQHSLSDALVARRARRMLSWITGFYLLTYLIGYPFSVPLFVFAYLLLEARARWWTGLLITTGVWLVVMVVFHQILGRNIPHGIYLGGLF